MNISFGTVIGVDIGSLTLKIAELRYSFRNFELVSYKETSFLTSEEGLPLIAETLKTLLPTKKLARKKVIVSMPGNKVAFRIITFPFVEKKKIDSVINFEIENLLPFDSEEIVIDHALLGKNGTTASVLCAVVEKREIDIFISDLKRAGIDPEAVDVDLFGFFNTVWTHFSGKVSPFMALNLDSHSSSILILDKGRLRCVKVVDIGYEQLVNEVSDPEKPKSSLTTDDFSEQQLNPEKVRELVTDLKRISGYMEFDDTNRIDEIFWCGKTVTGFTEILSKELEATVTHWNPLDMKGLKKGGFSLIGDARCAAVALGLSLKGTRGKFPGVDFKKRMYPERNVFHGLAGSLKTSLILSGALLFLTSSALYFKQSAFRNQLEGLRSEGKSIFKKALPEVTRVVNEVVQLKEKIGALDRDVKILGNVEGSSHSPINFLREISLHFPPKGTIEIFRYTFGKEDIRLEGVATSLKAVDKIKKEFSLIKGISKTQIASTKLASDKKSINFKIILTFNAAKG